MIMSTNTEVRTAGSSANKTKTMALIGVMAAVTCILGPLSLAIPVSPVPISLTNLAVYFAIYVLGMKRGTISYCIYLLLGLVGLPVFSAFTGGAGKLFGPTGGYLIGFIFMALICGLLLRNGRRRFTCISSAWYLEQQYAMSLEPRGLHLQHIWASEQLLRQV